MTNTAQKEAMDRAGELPLERRVAERRSNADIIGKMEFDLDAYESLCQGKDATIAALNRKLERAERALVRGGFVDHGGEEWKPPLGKPPKFIAVDFSVDYLNEVRAAARNEALEEAAMLCESDDQEYEIGRRCAAAIRALASHPAAPVQPLGYISKFEREVLEGGDAIGLTVFNEARKDRNVPIYAAPPVQQTGDVREAAAPTRLDVMSLIRSQMHRVYASAIDREEIDTKHMREIEDAIMGIYHGRYIAGYDLRKSEEALATTRPSAELTDEQIDELYRECAYTEAGEAEIRFARAILAASGGAHAVPGWISVTDRLPEHQQSVAFVVDAVDWARFQHLHGRVYGGTFNELDGCFNVPGVGFIASHWMPLPAAPTKDQGEGNA